MHRIPLVLAGVLLVLAWPAGTRACVAAAQDGSTAPDAPTADATLSQIPAADDKTADGKAAAPIPLADIPAEVQLAGIRLEEIGRIVGRNRAVTDLAKEFEVERQAIDALIALHSQPSTGSPTRRSLGDQQREWVRRKAQLADGREIAGERATTLASLQAELARQEAVWQATLDAARNGSVPAEIIELVQEILRRTTDLSTTVTAQTGEALQLQSRIVRSLGTIQQAEDHVDEQLVAARRSLFELDAPLIWKAFDTLEASQDLQGTVGAGWSRIRESLRSLADAYRLEIYFHLASMLLVFLTLAWFRRRLEQPPDEPSAAAARRVLVHPVAGTVLITALTALLLYPRASLSIYDLALVASVPALLTILPAFLEPELLRPVTAGALLFTMQRVGSLFIGETPYQRPGVLLISLAAAAGLLWMLRKGGVLDRLGSRGFSGPLRLSARLGALVFVVAAISNIVGNVSLALFLTGGMLVSGYVLLLMVTVVRVADGMVIVFTLSRLAGVSRFVSQHRSELLRKGLRLLHFAVAAGWLCTTLWIFELWRPAVALVDSALGASLPVGELNLSLGATAIFVGTVWLSVLLGRTVSSLLEVDVLSRMDLPRGLPSMIGRLTRYALISLGFFMALAAIGVELTQLTIIGGALGVGIGFGLQNVVSNFVSGLILAFERPIREGDVIQLDALNGSVRRIGFRASIIRTAEGADIIVPNASLISKEVINWTPSDQQRRLSVAVGVAYGSEVARVLSILQEVPCRHPGVQRTPAPQALFIGFGDSALDFELRFWTSDADHAANIRSDVTAAVNTALETAGIEIPFPQRDLHLRSVDARVADALRQASSADGPRD